MGRIRVKYLLANATVFLVALSATAATCEVLTRLLFGNSTALTPRYHTSAVYGDITLRQTRPNMVFTHTTPDGSWQFATNSQGFRNYDDFNHTKPRGRMRIVALGDSHTQGHECHQDYTYSSTIEKYLAARGIEAEVLNTGVSGFSTAEAYLLLEREMVKYSPDFIVLGFFANDYEDNLKAGFYQLDGDGDIRLVKKEHVPGVQIQDFIYAIPGIQWLGENSYFYSKLFNTTWDFYKSRLAETAQRSIPTEFAVSTKSSYTEYEISLAAALIRKIQAASTEAGAKFILLDIPQSNGANEFTPSVTEELFLAVEHHIDHFVPSSHLERFQGVAPFHVPSGGGHITEFTHTLLGVEVAEYILEQTALDTVPTRT